MSDLNTWGGGFSGRCCGGSHDLPGRRDSRALGSGANWVNEATEGGQVSQKRFPASAMFGIHGLDRQQDGPMRAMRKPYGVESHARGLTRGGGYGICLTRAGVQNENSRTHGFFVRSPCSVNWRASSPCLSKHQLAHCQASSTPYEPREYARSAGSRTSRPLHGPGSRSGCLGQSVHHPLSARTGIAPREA